MMNDQELLTWAAKAAGFVRPDPEVGRPVGPNHWCEACGPGVLPFYWDPLNDDAAALRLAVKLRLWGQVSERSVWIAQNADEIFGNMAASTLVMFADAVQQTRAAVRMAIVKAAAQIGRNAPGTTQSTPNSD